MGVGSEGEKEDRFGAEDSFSHCDGEGTSKGEANSTAKPNIVRTQTTALDKAEA